MAISKVCRVAPVEANSIVLNSGSERLAPAKTMVPPVAEVKTTSPVPLLQPAESVELLVHVPLINHSSLPKAIAELADEMFTFPLTVPVPDVLVMSPPESVISPLTVRACALFANVPPDMVSTVAVSWLLKVRVPPDTMTVAKVEPEEMFRVPVPEKVTDELVAVKFADVTDEVSQFPVDMVMVADAKVATAEPDDVRLLAPKVSVPALVAVNVPDHVKLAEKVVLMPLSTVRLFAVCEMLIVPLDVSISTVDVPTV